MLKNTELQEALAEAIGHILEENIENMPEFFGNAKFRIVCDNCNQLADANLSMSGCIAQVIVQTIYLLNEAGLIESEKIPGAVEFLNTHRFDYYSDCRPY